MMALRNLSNQERIDWLRLARTKSVGPVTFSQLITRYGSAGAAIEHLPELTRKRPLTPPPVSQIEDEIAKTDTYGARILAACEPDYPVLLRAVDPPPPIITVFGKTNLFSKDALAVVGARNASAAGRKIARDISNQVGKAGYVIVSGMAAA